MTGLAAPASAWAAALQVADLFAVAPALVGGIAVRGPAGPVRDRWWAHLQSRLPPSQPVCKVPAHVGDERLIGGLDLAATLRGGRPVVQRGLLAQADGGVLLLAMAERLGADAAARIGAVIDSGEVVLAREGLSWRAPSRFGVVAFDEGEGDETLAAALADRLAFHVDLTHVTWREASGDAVASWPVDAVASARERLPQVVVGDDGLRALCATSAALGVGSARADWLAVCVARVAAALEQRVLADAADAERAALLVLVPRAVPAAADASQPAPAADETTSPPSDAADPGDAPIDPPEEGEVESAADLGSIEASVVPSAQAALAAGLLAGLPTPRRRAGGAPSAGRVGAMQRSTRRGRPVGVQRGEPRRGARLELLATLRAAAPWQRLRRAGLADSHCVVVQPEDFRVARFKQRSRTTTVFAIDASGSSALHRLGEAKGAVELLLAECYVRRDQVAVLAFRGAGAELLLPPTRSLVRAKRSLAALPGGGGTPLAAGMDAAWLMADSLRRQGDTPLVVLLTDGRANIARDGQPDRAAAERDALKAAERWRAAGFTALLVDTSPRAEPRAQALAARMQATYLALPHAEATVLSGVVRQAAAALAT
jgi:magnesium chelatase subunit D